MEDQATAEAPLLDFGTEDNHDLGKFDLSSGGARGQVEQVAAKQVVEDQAPKKAPLPRDLINLGADDDTAMAPVTKNTHDPGPVPHLPINKVSED